MEMMMSDTGTGSKAAKSVKKKGLGQGWNASADGSTDSKTFAFGAAEEAGKLAKRALQLAQKGGHAIELRLAGSKLTVGLAAAAGAVAEGERRLAKRLQGKPTEEAKAAKVARIAAKADKPAKAPKAAKPAKPAKPAKAPAAAKRAPKA
jgi:hypothetical protein